MGALAVAGVIGVLLLLSIGMKGRRQEAGQMTASKTASR
jgi:hypothetical protein